MEHLTKLIEFKDIEVIKSLWESLNAQHLQNSKDFKDHYARQTFESRFSKIKEMSEENVHIEAVFDSDNKPAGYCVCSIENGVGELDSIYLEPALRRGSIGTALARSGIDWMKEKGCDPIVVTVADGNESVLPFYRRLGFGVRRTVLQLK